VITQVEVPLPPQLKRDDDEAPSGEHAFSIYKRTLQTLTIALRAD
jgi:hypothetical protein